MKIAMRHFANIQKAARHYGIDVEEKSWRELGKKPRTTNPAITGCGGAVHDER